MTPQDQGGRAAHFAELELEIELHESKRRHVISDSPGPDLERRERCAEKGARRRGLLGDSARLAARRRGAAAQAAPRPGGSAD